MHADNHLIAQKRKKFFDEFVEFRATTPAARAEEQSPMLLVTNRMASEGHSVCHWFHQVVRLKALPKLEVIRKMNALGFQSTQWCGTLCFFKFGPRMAFGPDLYVEYAQSSKSFEVVGEFEEAEAFRTILKKTWRDTHTQVDKATRVDNYGCHTSAGMIERGRMPHQSFYPGLNRPMRKYFDDFMASKANVLLLIGPPGTGKSSFASALIQHTRAKTLVATSKEVLESPMLYEKVRDRGYELLIAEDATDFLMAREKGNQHMSTLLNDTQGIASASNLKVVVSTNLPTERDIDEALLRPGRCFDRLHFPQLTQEQVHAVWDDVGKPHRPLPVGRTWSLADILNDEVMSVETQPRRTIGFAPAMPKAA